MSHSLSDQWLSDKATYWAVCGQLKTSQRLPEMHLQIWIFYIFLQRKLFQIQQSLSNIGFAYFIFIEAVAAHWMRTKSCLKFCCQEVGFSCLAQLVLKEFKISSVSHHISWLADLKSRWSKWRRKGVCFWRRTLWKSSFRYGFCTVVSDSKPLCRWN